jgi:hypothetical protein
MRFYTYFFEQFLHAILNADPYVDPKAEFEMQTRRKSIRAEHVKTITDF